jgi:hypothetical protein
VIEPLPKVTKRSRVAMQAKQRVVALHCRPLPHVTGRFAPQSHLKARWSKKSCFYRLFRKYILCSIPIARSIPANAGYGQSTFRFL